MRKKVFFITVVFSTLWFMMSAMTSQESFQKTVTNIQTIINAIKFSDNNINQLVKTKYYFSYNFRDSILTFTDIHGNTRDKINHDTLRSITTCHLNDLHSKGFTTKKLQNGLFVLVIMPINNEKRFVSVTYFNSAKKQSFIQNSLTVGSLDSVTLLHLKSQFEILATYAKYNLDQYKPDKDIGFVFDLLNVSSLSEYDNKNWKNYKAYYSTYVDTPPLFINATTYPDNKSLVEQYH